MYCKYNYVFKILFLFKKTLNRCGLLGLCKKFQKIHPVNYFLLIQKKNHKTKKKKLKIKRDIPSSTLFRTEVYSFRVIVTITVARRNCKNCLRCWKRIDNGDQKSNDDQDGCKCKIIYTLTSPGRRRLTRRVPVI